MKTPNPEERIIFLQILLQSAKREKSDYAKLLFQENIITVFIISTLHTISLVINEGTMQQRFKKGRTINVESVIKLIFDDKDLEGKTLGQLCQVLYPYLSQETPLKDLLKRFVVLRNKLTHNMFDKYENMAQLEKDSAELVAIGDGIIKNLSIFRTKLMSN